MSHFQSNHSSEAIPLIFPDVEPSQRTVSEEEALYAEWFGAQLSVCRGLVRQFVQADAKMHSSIQRIYKGSMATVAGKAVRKFNDAIFLPHALLRAAFIEGDKENVSKWIDFVENGINSTEVHYQDRLDDIQQELKNQNAKNLSLKKSNDIIATADELLKNIIALRLAWDNHRRFISVKCSP